MMNDDSATIEEQDRLLFSSERVRERAVLELVPDHVEIGAGDPAPSSAVHRVRPGAEGRVRYPRQSSKPTRSGRLRECTCRWPRWPVSSEGVALRGRRPHTSSLARTRLRPHAHDIVGFSLLVTRLMLLIHDNRAEVGSGSNTC